MTSTALKNLLSRKILYLLALPLVISACSTEGMEFNVSDQALTQDTSQVQAAENQNAQTDETSAEDTYTQDVIPQSPTEGPTEETVQPIPEEKKDKTDAELDCTQQTPPDISHWPYRSPLGDAQNLLMVDARLGAHFDFDRFVLEFEPNLSGDIAGPPDSYSIQWVSQPPMQFGSGEPIEVEGTEYLEILIHAYAYSRTSMPSEYAGPTKVQARGTLNVIEAVFGGEVEGKMVWAIGANNQTGFRVLEIPDPPRLVIDICTSASG